MIFDRAERELLFRTEVRKACESAMIGTNESISPVKRQILASRLAQDVNRCHAMIRLADNDLSEIRGDVKMFDKESVDSNLGLLSEYMSSLKDTDREDEGVFMFLTSYMVTQLPTLTWGIGYADVLIKGGNPLSETEMISLVKVRNILEPLMEYAEEMLEYDGDAPYAEAYEFIECLLEECSIVLRIGSGGGIGLDEMAFHLEWVEEVDQEAFERLFLIDMETDDRGIMEDFLEDQEERIRMIIGRCIADQELGLIHL